MRFDEKARENLEAVARLLPDEGGAQVDAWPNAAASRAYYAAYLAVADGAQRMGEGFTSEKGYYRHDTLPEDAGRWGLLDEDAREDLAFLYGLRIKADYWEDQVDLAEASEALNLASALTRKLLGPGEAA